MSLGADVIRYLGEDGKRESFEKILDKFTEDKKSRHLLHVELSKMVRAGFLYLDVDGRLYNSSGISQLEAV